MSQVKRKGLHPHFKRQTRPWDRLHLILNVKSSKNPLKCFFLGATFISPVIVRVVTMSMPHQGSLISPKYFLLEVSVHYYVHCHHVDHVREIYRKIGFFQGPRCTCTSSLSCFASSEGTFSGGLMSEWLQEQKTLSLPNTDQSVIHSRI